MILEFTVWLLWELILYNIGRAVIAVFSLGRARAESLKEALRTSEPRSACRLRRSSFPRCGRSSSAWPRSWWRSPC